MCENKTFFGAFLSIAKSLNLIFLFLKYFFKNLNVFEGSKA